MYSNFIFYWTFLSDDSFVFFENACNKIIMIFIFIKKKKTNVINFYLNHFSEFIILFKIFSLS